MILWLIAVVLVASVATVGYYQGALRAAFSLLGLLLASLLAMPLASLIHPLLVIFGMSNPILLAFAAPFIGFLVVLIGFKLAAVAVHKQAETWYKYKASDTQRMLWERMNARVGIPVGMANGLVYFLAICTFIYSLGYLTVQVATSDQDSWMLRVVTRLAEDMKETGMDKAVARFMPGSELYYDSADVAADIFQTPLLQNRLANYPPFLTLGEKEEFKPLSDPGFQAEWIKGISFGSFIHHPKISPLVENHAVFTNILGMVGGDLKDLKAYLETGKSAKFDDEKILGRWAFSFKSSVALARRKKPTMGSAELTRLRKTLATAFLNGQFTATVDNRAILKLASAGSGSTTGRWKTDKDGRYIFELTEAGKTLELEVIIEGRELIFSKDGYVLVFENTRV